MQVLLYLINTSAVTFNQNEINATNIGEIVT